MAALALRRQAIIAALLWAIPANAALIAEESFAYPAGTVPILYRFANPR